MKYISAPHKRACQLNAKAFTLIRLLLANARRSCELNAKAFTLIELLVVIAIIAVLSTLAAVSYLGVRVSLRDAEKKVDISNIAKAYEKNFKDSLYYPLSPDDFSTHTIPTPPGGGSYSGLLTAPANNFQVCAVLGTGSETSCSAPSSSCYCMSSVQK